MLHDLDWEKLIKFEYVVSEVYLENQEKKLCLAATVLPPSSGF